MDRAALVAIISIVAVIISAVGGILHSPVILGISFGIVGVAVFLAVFKCNQIPVRRTND